MKSDDLYPFVLNANDDFKGDVYLYMGIFMALLGIGLLNYMRIVSRSFDLRNTPTYKKIGVFGIEEDMIESINGEVREASKEGGIGKRVVTKTWVIDRGLFRLKITR